MDPVDPLWGKNRLPWSHPNSDPLGDVQSVLRMAERTPTPPRPDWDTYFLMGARWASTRADCRRARHGCLLVVDRRMVGAGYNGTPSKSPKSCVAGDCPRGLKSYDEHAGNVSGNHDFGDCINLHAEQNAIGDAAARGNAIRGATSYQTGAPCDMCKKLLQASGIIRVVYPEGEMVW